MKNLTTYIYTLAIISLSISCSTTRLNPEDVMPPSEGRPTLKTQVTDKLTFEIRTDKENYLIGEPVYLYAYLTNSSREDLKLLGKLRPGSGAVHIKVSHSGEETKTYIPLTEADHGFNANITLDPGNTIGDVFQIFFGGAGWSFNEEGEYIISAHYTTKAGEGQFVRTHAEEVSIKVSDSGNDVIRQMVSGDRSSYQAGFFMAWQAGDHLTKGLALLNNILKSDVEFPIRNVVNFALAKRYSEHFTDYRINETRPANCELTKKYLDPVDPEALPEPLRVQYFLAVARCQYNHLVQQPNQARQAYRNALEIMGRDEAYQNLRIRVHELMDGVK